jgi:hypothetical protein
MPHEAHLRLYSSGQARIVSCQRGFAGFILLAILVSALLVAAFAYMGRQSRGGMSEASAKLNAAVLMRQSGVLAEAIEELKLRRGVATELVTFDDAPGTGLYAATLGLAVPSVPLVPSGALDETGARAAPVFAYSSRISLPGIGTAADDIAIILPHVSMSVCEQINTILNSDPLGTEPPASTGRVSDWTFGNVDDGELGARYVGRSEGCVHTVDNAYVYYRVVAQN